MTEVDRICRSGDGDATHIAQIIKAGGAATKTAIFSGEVLLDGADTDPGGRRIRDFQARAMGLKNYAQLQVMSLSASGGREAKQLQRSCATLRCVEVSGCEV